MKITIEKLEDGSFTVGEDEPEGMQGAGMPGTQGAGPMLPEEGGQAYPDLDSALNAARQMLSGDAQDKPMMEGESDFVGGFKSARGIGQGF